MRQNYINSLGSTIMDYVKASGCFSRAQAYLMLQDKHYSTVDKTLYALTKERYIFQVDTDYFVGNPRGKINYDMIACLWVLLDMKGNLVPGTDKFFLNNGTRPSYLSYVINGIMYDIVPLDRTEMIVMKYIDEQYAREKAELPESEHRYLFLMKSEDDIAKTPSIKAPHMFALVKEIDESAWDKENKVFANVEYFEDEDNA